MRLAGAMACAEPDGESAQLLSCLSHQFQIRLAVMGLSAHMEPADDGIGVRAVKLPVSVQDVQDSVVGAAGKRPWPLCPQGACAFPSRCKS